MGFPVYTEVFLPKLFVHTLSFMGFIRNLVLCLFNYLGLSDFLETDNIWPDNPTRIHTDPPVSVALIREILPVVKFEDLVGELPESCAVCLYEFEAEAEVRRLKNCKHIFHRVCLDRWMDHDRNTCPLCRTSFVPDEMKEEYNQRLLAASDDTDFYDSLGNTTATTLHHPSQKSGNSSTWKLVAFAISSSAVAVAVCAIYAKKLLS